ncbi:MAG: hypothetical protein ACQGVK_16420 [Myxococcota bacterium]
MAAEAGAGSRRAHGPARARRFRLPVGLALAVLCLAPPARGELLARADAAWADRALGARDGVALPGPVGEAIEAYEAARAARPQALEPEWKLLRALHFAAAFTSPQESEAAELHARATRVAEQAMERLARRVGSGTRLDRLDPGQVEARIEGTGVTPRDVARLHFWAAIHWGAWSRTVGLVSAVRRGVASRLHRYTTLAVSLEPGYEEGGALRLLGRLHSELPRVPFLTGWVDRDRAIPLLARALELAPQHPGNRLLMGLTLLDLEPERSREAWELIGEVARGEPRPSMRIEDLALRRAARDLLAQAPEAGRS